MSVTNPFDTTHTPVNRIYRLFHMASSSSLYTAEQVEEVKQFLKLDKNDYYAVLSVPRNAEADEIKRAYKKQALRFHPDKNQAPGADEAFKMVGTAFACLSSEEKKRQYDMFGARGVGGSSSGGDNGPFRFPTGNHFQFAQNGDIPMEDLFNMFFNVFADERFMQQAGGNGFYFATSSFPQFPQFPNFAPNVRQRRRPQTGHFQEEMDRRQRQRRGQDEEDNTLLIRLVQMLPLFFIVFLSFLSNLLFPSKD